LAVLLVVGGAGSGFGFGFTGGFGGGATTAKE